MAKGRGGGVVGLISIAFTLLTVGLLIYFGLQAENPGGTSKHPGIASHSKAETTLQLCAEGRPSATYGDPPTQAQQAACLRAVAGQAAGNDGVPAPLPTSTTTPGLGSTPGSGSGSGTSLGTTTHPRIPPIGGTAGTTTTPSAPGAGLP